MFQYKLGFIPTSFVVIGVGGTGGRLVPLLAQFIKTINWIQNPRIYLIDHDVVEEKNLVRQNFIRLDLGKPKAVVLAERYGKAYDITMVPVVKRVEEGTATPLTEVQHADLGVIKTALDNINNAIIFLCVDSAGARRGILNGILQRNGNANLLFIDSGNENDFGQVTLFNPVYPHCGWMKEDIELLKIPGMSGLPFNTDIDFLPYPIKFYDEMEDAGTRSCAELDQTLAINATMATSIMGIVQSLIYRKPLPYSKVNISLIHGSIPEMMTVSSLYNMAKDMEIKPPKRTSFPARAYDLNTTFHNTFKKLKSEFAHLLKKPEDDSTKAASAVKKKKKVVKKKSEVEWTDYSVTDMEAEEILESLLENGNE